MPVTILSGEDLKKYQTEFDKKFLQSDAGHMELAPKGFTSDERDDSLAELHEQLKEEVDKQSGIEFVQANNLQQREAFALLAAVMNIAEERSKDKQPAQPIEVFMPGNKITPEGISKILDKVTNPLITLVLEGEKKEVSADVGAPQSPSATKPDYKHQPTPRPGKSSKENHHRISLAKETENHKDRATQSVLQEIVKGNDPSKLVRQLR